MNFNINFQKAKRNYMTLTFDDETADGKTYEKAILVGMPKKRIYDMLMDLSGTLELAKETASKEERARKNKQLLNDLYLLVSEILSNNMNKEKISVEWVEEQMSPDDMKMFLQQYVKFCKGEAASPN